MDVTFRNNTALEVASTTAVSPLTSHSCEVTRQFETVRHRRSGEMPREELGAPFGQYRLIEEIGRGGGGVVYSADQDRPKRKVAIKILHAGERSTDDEVRRLHAEADAAASLEHQYIVPVYEVGEFNGHSQRHGP